MPTPSGSRKKGTVTRAYYVATQPRHVVFSATDAKPGIPADQGGGEIFERFVKFDNFSHGMGLELSVCRMIAQRLGGSLHADQTYTTGARFIFTRLSTDNTRTPIVLT